MLRLIDCKRMLSYYHVKSPSNLKEIKHTAIQILVNKMCYCDKKIQYILYRRYYNSRNNKNLNHTRRILGGQIL